jgi:hypothetical protein
VVDVAAAVIVTLWMVFDLRLRHGFRNEVPPLWLGVLTAIGRTQLDLDLDLMLVMATYTAAVACRRPVAALGGAETALIICLTAAAAALGARSTPRTAC